MAECIEIQGGVALHGTVPVSGAKNAVLPLCMATLLASEPCEFTNVPNLEDVHLTVHLLEHFGAEVSHTPGRLAISVPRLIATEASYSLVKALRASFWVLGPLLARGRAARVALPGGDIIGARPVDLHLQALTQMGADIKVKNGVVYALAENGLRPARVSLRFPSVGATHQIIMAAALTPGTTVIEGAAREPEIVAVADFINAIGGLVEGAGSSTVVIHGRESLGGASQRVIGDRIEAGTYLLAGAASGGDITAVGIDPTYFGTFLDLLSEMGLSVETTPNSVRVKRVGELKPVSFSTAPFPLIATDLQAPIMAALCTAHGESSVEETVYEGRFGHVSELCRMGAKIRIEDRIARISGVPRLAAAPVEGFDIRAAAALVVAGLGAEGVTTLYEPHHLRRGYESLEEKLIRVGARIQYRSSDLDDYHFVGC